MNKENMNSSDGVVAHLLEQERARNQEYKTKIMNLNETITDLKASNYRMEKECSETRHANSLLIDDQNKYKREIRDLATTVSRLESKVAEAAGSDSGSSVTIHNNMKLLVNQKDEIQRKYNEILSQHEVLKTQYNNTIIRHKEEIQLANEIEIQMNDEAERLTQELKSLHQKVIHVDTDRKRIENLYKSESSESIITITKLKHDHESLQHEIEVLSQQNEVLCRDNSEYVNSIQDYQQKLHHMEHNLKSIANNDRSNLQNESIHYESSISSLQLEQKQLISEIEHEKLRYQQVDDDLGKLKEKYRSLHREFSSKDSIIDSLQQNITTLEAESKRVTSNAADMKASLVRIQNEHKALRQEYDHIVTSNHMNNRMKEAEDSIKDKNEVIKKLHVSYDELLIQYNLSLSTIESSTQQNSSLFIENESLLHSVDHLSRQVDDIRSQYEVQQHEVQQLSEKNDTIIHDLEVSRADNHDLHSRIDALTRQSDEIQRQNDHLKQENLRYEEESKSYDATLHKHHNIIESLQSQLEALSKQHHDDHDAHSTERTQLQLAVVEYDASILQLQDQLSHIQADHVSQQQSYEQSYAILQQSSNQSIQNLMNEVKVLDNLLHADRTQHKDSISMLQDQCHMLQSQIRTIQQRYDDLEEASMKDKSCHAMKMLQLEQEYEKKMSEMQRLEMHIADIMAERDAITSKYKTLKDASRVMEAKLRVLEASSPTSASTIAELPTSPAIASMTMSRNIGISSTPEKRLPEPTTSSRQGEDPDIDSFIVRTQKIIEKKSKSIHGIMGDTMDGSNQQAAYQQTADTALALVSTAYEKQQTSSSSPTRSHVVLPKENVCKVDNIVIEAHNISIGSSNKGSLSPDKKPNTFRDRLSRSIKAASNVLK